MDRFLESLEPFKRLAPAERARLLQHAHEKRYAKGQTLFREGELSDAVWVVKTGRVHLMKFLGEGKVSTTCVMTPGELFCCLPALDRKQYPVDAMAAVESAVIRIPAEAFHQAMDRSPAFTHETLCLFCDRLRQVEQKSCMVYEAAEQRLARVLLGLAKKFGSTIPLTRQELAEIAGTTHETAIRTLSHFRQQGLIRSRRGTTTLLKPEKLTALLDQG
jgi:CRP/FNR family transcriptional regulator